MQCVGLERRFHMKDKYSPGTGVVTSGGEYRRLTGKIFVPDGVVRRLGLNGRIPLPFVVVHSGKTTMTLCGCSARRVFRSVIFAPFGGCSCGLDRARRMAPKSEISCT